MFTPAKRIPIAQHGVSLQTGQNVMSEERPPQGSSRKNEAGPSAEK
jgi:hypothetical protein